MLKPLDDFGAEKLGKDGKRSRCKDCRNTETRFNYHKDPEAKRKNREKRVRLRIAKPEKDKNRELKCLYSITLDQYFDTLAKQNGRCAICKTDDPGPGMQYFSVDHDHTCCPGKKSCGKCIRGLLCHTCNKGLGAFKDSEEALIAASTYLANYKQREV